jgi:hypothetical protein
MAKVESLTKKPITSILAHGTNNIYTGLGEFKYVSGDTYLGGFLNDTLQGHGEYKYSNGNIYVGNFDNNQRNGTGEFINNKEKFFYNGK